METIRNPIEIFFKAEKVDINEMVFCELKKDDELWLHIDDVRDKPLREKIRLLNDGFKKLAEYLVSDERLANVKRITGTSWIVAKHPKTLERLGFGVITDENLFKEHAKAYRSKSARSARPREFKDLNPAHAYIDRDEFVRLYANK